MKRYIHIGDRKIGDGERVFIIAEAGVNHNGSLVLAKKMVDVAKSAGADAIKFQTFKTEDLMAKDVRHRSRYDMLKRLELNNKEFEFLNSYCKKKKIIFLSTPFDLESANFLYKLRVPAFKIASGELTNTPLLMQIAGYRKPIILSTGMATLKEVREALDAIYSAGNKKLILLHCTSNYPAKYEDINLKAMDTLKKEFDVTVGYSDHTEGVEVSVAAVARGAKVIEKHITLDKNLPGPDHKASMEPGGFCDLVKAIRNIEKAIGSGVKKPSRSEKNIKAIARKSIVAACDIKKGASLTPAMLSIKRPGTGIEPRHIKRLLNRKILTDIKEGEILTWSKITI